MSFGPVSGYFGSLQEKKKRKYVCTTDILGKEKGEKRAEEGGTADKFSLSLVINPGKCSVQNERQPEKKLATAGKYPKSFCRMRTHEWGNVP